MLQSCKKKKSDFQKILNELTTQSLSNRLYPVSPIKKIWKSEFFLQLCSISSVKVDVNKFKKYIK
jgi:hypothetical protein